MNLFVDTSALVKFYYREMGTDNFINSLHRQDNLVITTTTRIVYKKGFIRRDLLSSITTIEGVKISKLSLKNVKEALTFFEQEVFHLVEVDVFAKEFAIQLLNQIAHRYNLAALDAMQLATAILSHQDVASVGRSFAATHHSILKRWVSFLYPPYACYACFSFGLIRDEKFLKTILKMLRNGIEIGKISKITKLPEEVITQLPLSEVMGFANALPILRSLLFVNLIYYINSPVDLHK